MLPNGVQQQFVSWYHTAVKSGKVDNVLAQNVWSKLSL